MSQPDVEQGQHKDPDDRAIDANDKAHVAKSKLHDEKPDKPDKTAHQ